MRTKVGQNSILDFGLFSKKSEGDNKGRTETCSTKIILLLIELVYC